jgi:vacuolar-type H+-ATPase subunit D/Vma8
MIRKKGDSCMATSNEIKNGINKLDEKTHELIMEFHSHYEEYIKLKPEDKDRKDEIFQSWVIQKIAGIHISILELAESLNTLIKKSHYH